MSGELNLSMIRAYDIRTPAEALTPELAERLAWAEAAYFRRVLGVPGVVVAHDARRSGPRYLEIAVEVFRAAGLEVVHLPGVCSSSYFYFAAMQHPDCAAVMFGASHNPASDTGQKLLGPGVAPIAAGIGPEGGLDCIRSLYIAGERCPAPRRSAVRCVELMNRYVDLGMELAGVQPGGLRGFKLLHDYLYGAAGREMMLAFDLAGAELCPLHFVPDGGFPLGAPNPVIQDVIAPGLRQLRHGDFVWGAFFDGDGDRIDIYRGDGEYLSSSFVYAAILPEIRRRHAGAGLGVFADLKANPLAVIEMARSGVAVDVIRNGHSQIKWALAQDVQRFGAVEESAHFYEAFSPQPGRRFCTEDTLYIALLVARVWREDPARLERLFAIQARTAREREWGYRFPDDTRRTQALRAVREMFEAEGAQSLERMKNGMDLEATMMRRGLPFDIGPETRLADDWLQVCQRISQSEDGLARWEVVGARPDLVREAKRRIAECAARFGAGEEYQG